MRVLMLAPEQGVGDEALEASAGGVAAVAMIRAVSAVSGVGAEGGGDLGLGLAPGVPGLPRGRAGLGVEAQSFLDNDPDGSVP